MRKAPVVLISWLPLKKDHIRLNKEVADLFKVACNTQLDKEHDKNKPPVMPYVAAQ